MMTPHAFHDLPERAFPFLICIIDAETHELRWSAWVDGPGGVRIPGKDSLARSPSGSLTV